MAKDGRGDRIFALVTFVAAVLIAALVSAIALFLVIRAAPAFRSEGAKFFTEKIWFPDATPSQFGVAAMAFGTLVSSAVALLLAVPVALGTALFVVELAPRRLGRWIGSAVDVLAVVPSVVYGLWGVAFLVPKLIPLQRFLDRWFGFIPLLHSRTGTYGRSLLAASVVLAIMILPIIAALSREVLSQVPHAQREAALALGATRWEVMRMAVLPQARSGVTAAALLGLGRALGETIAVALVLAASFTVNWHIVEPGGNTIAANIATKFGEAGGLGREALIASGVVLFVITLLVNVAARSITQRKVGQEKVVKKRARQ